MTATAARVSARRRGGIAKARASTMAFVVIAATMFITPLSAFYLPGVAPQDFAMGDPIPLKVNKLASVKTQLPFDFYSLPFCQPDEIVPSAENLGEVLRGDRIKNSAYEVAFKVDQACKVLCVKGPLTAAEAEQFGKAVAEEYRWYAIMDNLPLVTPIDASALTASSSASSSGSSSASSSSDDEGTGSTTASTTAAIGGTAGGGFDRGLPVGFLEASSDVEGENDDGDGENNGAGVGNEVALDDVAAEKKKKKKKHKDKKKHPKHARLYNHVSFVVRYSRPDPGTGLSRIVGFEAKPSSVRHKLDGSGKISAATCDPSALPRLAASFSSSSSSSDASNSLSSPSTIPVDVHPAEAEEGETVVFSYDVAFAVSDVAWATRWNEYLDPAPGDGRVHWFSVLNSLAVVAFLAVMVGAIVARALRADIAAYNALDSAGNGANGSGSSSLVGLAEDAADESGWKLLHGDVFRPCKGRTLLAAGVGAGAQLAATLAGTLAFAVAGFLSPANRGALGTAAPLLFAGSGLVGGYASARIYKLLRGPSPARATAAAAFLFPAAVGGIGLAMNAAAAGAESSGAVPFSTLAALVALWLALSTPLVFAGAWIGYRKPLPACPVRVNKIPRQVPAQPGYLHPAASALAAGVVVFSAVFIEFFFVLTSIWGQRFYYLFGFLVLAAAVALATAAEIAVVLCYFQLCAEDYRWWWRAFLNGGGVAAYIFAYSAFYFFTRLEITSFVPSLLYFGYMACVSLAVFCLTGSVGLWACLKFVRSIYAAVKID